MHAFWTLISSQIKWHGKLECKVPHIMTHHAQSASDFGELFLILGEHFAFKNGRWAHQNNRRKSYVLPCIATLLTVEWQRPHSHCTHKICSGRNPASASASPKKFWNSLNNTARRNDRDWNSYYCYSLEGRSSCHRSSVKQYKQINCSSTA